MLLNENEERETLAAAIIAAADREYSTFKDAVSDTLERRFKDKIDAVAKDKMNRLFNPDYVAPEEQGSDEEEIEDTDDSGAFDDLDQTDDIDSGADEVD